VVRENDSQTDDVTPGNARVPCAEFVTEFAASPMISSRRSVASCLTRSLSPSAAELDEFADAVRPVLAARRGPEKADPAVAPGTPKPIAAGKQRRNPAGTAKPIT
jgi:hypothetical protein